MDIDYLAIFQQRMDRAAAEQVWSIAILGPLHAFIIIYATKLRKVLTERQGIWGIRIITVLVCLFIWSRHGIYWYYSRQHDLFANISSLAYLNDLTWYEALARLCVMWSGVFLYTAISVGMAYVSVQAFKKAELELGHNDEI